MAGTARCVPSGGPAAEASAGAETAHTPWTELEDHLDRARRSILAEIRSYPPPIAACDQQFNYLLEERDRIADALSRLASIRRDYSAYAQTDVKALMEFVAASDRIAREPKAQLVQLLNQRLGDRA